MFIIRILIISLLFFISLDGYAGNMRNAKECCSTNLIEIQDANQSRIPPFFGVAFYKPNYILPYYYTGSPYNNAYIDNTPDDESINNSELKFQFSFKAPIWQNIFHSYSSLFVAYTQLSYFQLYNKKTFVRESDYEPEIFLANRFNYAFGSNWLLNNVNVGVVHESNGFGNDLQRGWDRIYLEAIASNDKWVVSLQPWYVFGKNDKNSDITKYLGYGRILTSFEYCQHKFTLRAYNLIENGSKYPSGEFTYSFPLIKYFKGYIQVFSGYGQSLLEFNHRTNSAGIGFAIGDPSS